MSEINETTLNSIGREQISIPKSTPKKVGRPRKYVQSEEFKEIYMDYKIFCDKHPGYEMGKFKVTSTEDEELFKIEFEYLKEKQRLDESIEALPMNFHFLTQIFTKGGEFYAKQVKGDEELAERMVRFKYALSENYNLLEEPLIELLEKYPFLRRQKVMVELRLGLILFQLWRSTADTEIQVPENIPNKFKSL
jgi:hypothetical protein